LLLAAMATSAQMLCFFELNCTLHMAAQVLMSFTLRFFFSVLYIK